ncbi:MAG TPA: hypothetical protein PKI94_04745 [Candidatus Gastranaerophilaceae bacterium]|nr:hypothetical protein [Candidatus Gastranaerophilaceae bacterium]
MKKKITTKDLIKEFFTPEEAQEIQKEIVQEVEKIKWGGKRPHAGRKPKTGVVLEFRIRVSEKEKQFIDYARSHNLNFDKLMKG